MHVHGLPDVLNLHRIGADNELAEIFDAGHRRSGLALQGAFAPSYETLVGFQLAKYVWPVGGGGQRNAEHLHARDLQTRLQWLEARQRCPLLAAAELLWRKATAAIDGGAFWRAALRKRQA